MLSAVVSSKSRLNGRRLTTLAETSSSCDGRAASSTSAVDRVWLTRWTDEDDRTSPLVALVSAPPSSAADDSAAVVVTSSPPDDSLASLDASSLAVVSARSLPLREGPAAKAFAAMTVRAARRIRFLALSAAFCFVAAVRSDSGSSAPSSSPRTAS